MSGSQASDTTVAAHTRHTSWVSSPWRIIARAVGAALAILILAALLALMVVPRLLGGDSLTVLTGSMEPSFSPGDVVVVAGVSEGDVCADITVGAIVTYFPEPNNPALISHRVIGKTIGTFEDGTSCRLITQGDANTSVDEPVSPAQVRGVFMYGVPQLGWVRQWAGQNPMVLLAVAAAGLLGWGLWNALRKPRTRVITIPGSAQSSTLEPLLDPAQEPVPDPTPGGPVVAGAPAASAAPFGSQYDHAMWERELALRERELDLRERELSFAERTEN